MELFPETEEEIQNCFEYLKRSYEMITYYVSKSSPFTLPEHSAQFAWDIRNLVEALTPQELFQVGMDAHDFCAQKLSRKYGSEVILICESIKNMPCLAYKSWDSVYQLIYLEMIAEGLVLGWPQLSEI